MSEAELNGNAPPVEYEPPEPEAYDPGIGLIGCGEITEHHLTAYRQAGYRVVAFCDLEESRARSRRDEFYPEADIHTDHREVLAREDVEVVDVATHPAPRAGIVEDAVRAGIHVLSQKPFVLDLDVGERLIALADDNDVTLAVNQNGRWAPHWSYVRRAVEAGSIGDVLGAHLSVHWDHGWIEGTPFEEIDHAILYDFAIHWFDVVRCLMDGGPGNVYASTARAPNQRADPSLLAQATIEYESAQASLAFDGAVPAGERDRTLVSGTAGTIESVGPSLDDQQVTIRTADGEASPELKGAWFVDGFAGTMGELLCAIEEGREPDNSGADNVASLELCFAAVASAERGAPVRSGTVRRLPGSEP